MTTFDERLELAKERVDHLSGVVDGLLRTHAPMRTVAVPRVALGAIDQAEADRLNASLIDQVPAHAVRYEEDILILAAVSRARPLDVVIEADPSDAPVLPALSVGLDGNWATGGEGGVADGRPVRRVRFGPKGGEGDMLRLAAIHLRLDRRGEVRLMRLAVEPAL